MPLTADQAAALVREMYVPIYANEHPVTTSVITAIPEDKASYKPDDVSKSAFDLAWHIVAAEHMFLAAVSAGAFDFTGNARPESVRTPMDVAAWYSAAFAADIEK